jgi:RNA polymerase sigma-70 factor, ECF subfamily
MATDKPCDRDILLNGILGYMVNIDPEESTLLLRARELDLRALSRIHDRYYPEICRYAFYRIGENKSAEDIASEVFLRLLVGLRSGKPPQNTLRGWLFGVASHLVADHFRHQSRLSDQDFMAASESPQAEAERNIQHGEVRMALRNLTTDQQEVLALRFGEGFSVEETAHILGKSVTAVKSMQFRAIEALRSLFGGVEV